MSLASPVLLALGQASGLVVASVRLPDVYQAAVQTITMYRGPSAVGPWTQVDIRRPSPFSRWQNTFDITPTYGSTMYYYCALDNGQTTSMQSYAAALAPPAIAAATGISSAAYGPYPLLGSDVYLNPATGEAVVGPNGDLLTVNGLQLLAQDLTIRFLTEKGELLLHPDFGLAGKIIGSGQANPTAQAQLLQTLIIDACLDDPRVDSVINVTITQHSFDGWVVNVTLVAIGSEGPNNLNLVFPYFLTSGA